MFADVFVILLTNVGINVTNDTELVQWHWSTFSMHKEGLHFFIFTLTVALFFLSLKMNWIWLR